MSLLSGFVQGMGEQAKAKSEEHRLDKREKAKEERQMRIFKMQQEITQTFQTEERVAGETTTTALAEKKNKWKKEAIKTKAKVAKDKEEKDFKTFYSQLPKRVSENEARLSYENYKKDPDKWNFHTFNDEENLTNHSILVRDKDKPEYKSTITAINRNTNQVHTFNLNEYGELSELPLPKGFEVYDPKGERTGWTDTRKLAADREKVLAELNTLEPGTPEHKRALETIASLTAKISKPTVKDKPSVSEEQWAITKPIFDSIRTGEPITQRQYDAAKAYIMQRADSMDLLKEDVMQTLDSLFSGVNIQEPNVLSNKEAVLKAHMNNNPGMSLDEAKADYEESTNSSSNKEEPVSDVEPPKEPTVDDIMTVMEHENVSRVEAKELLDSAHKYKNILSTFPSIRDFYEWRGTGLPSLKDLAEWSGLLPDSFSTEKIIEGPETPEGLKLYE